jgi:hypothetical protein
MAAPADLDAYPGGDLVAAGVRELAGGGAVGAAGLLVCIAAPRLRRLGIVVPPGGPADPERALYARLAEENPDAAHGRYNALVRRVTSFARAYAAASHSRPGAAAAGGA